jgi:hypothetical protein
MEEKFTRAVKAGYITYSKASYASKAMEESDESKIIKITSIIFMTNFILNKPQRI